MTAGAISQRVARAERDGLVERAPGPAGSRTVLVRLTAEGHALIERSVDTVLGREATLVSCLSANERASLIDLLAKLMADVRQRTIHPASHDATASSPSEGTRPENRA